VCGKGGCGRDGNDDDGNTVFVCNSTHHPALYADELFVDFDAFNWIGFGEDGGDSEQQGGKYYTLARVRHLQPLTPCTVTWIQSSDNKKSCGDKGHFMVQFDKATRAITPGQIVALYAGLD
jgi:tRNA U34 2-thiouridine synthase MnmA/TrmU